MLLLTSSVKNNITAVQTSYIPIWRTPPKQSTLEYTRIVDIWIKMKHTYSKNMLKSLFTKINSYNATFNM